MEEEEEARLLALFDFYWFDHAVLLKKNGVPTSAAADIEAELAAAAPPLSRRSSTLRRYLSDERAFCTSSDSALLVTRAAPKLSSVVVVSGGAPSEEEEEEEEGYREIAGGSRGVTEGVGDWGGGRGGSCVGKRAERRRARGTSGEGKRKSKSKSKSLSELAFEELKGFMDLGFTFPEAEADQRLLAIVPGLQKLGRGRASSEPGVGAAEAEWGEGGVGEPSVPRPYLSEAWDVFDLEERSRRSYAYDHLLRNWKVPAASEGVDMKGHLRSWAHAVASAVR